MHILPRKVVSYLRECATFLRALVLLVRAQAHTVPHKDKTLLAHLIGVYVLLSSWKVPRQVRYAGLLHSVYGTSIFKHAVVPIERRNEISALVGQDAERLAYLFSMAQRPQMWLTLTEKSELLPLRNGIAMRVSPKEVAMLAQIECANLFDLGEEPPREVIALSLLGERVAQGE